MPAATIDEYLAGVPDDQRAALKLLREQIHAAAPDAIEAISYGLPAFRLGGRFFAGFGAAKDHCSFYVGKAPLEAHKADLAAYRLWKGTINFQPDRPIPAELVTKLVEFRLAEYSER
jgi:uncharacterized protein YdhG (YjbR/CyaY superfamily)